MCALLASAAPAIAQTKKNVSGATVKRVLSTLAADEMQGRATGQPGQLKAAEFLAGEFARIGLEPLPGATSFRQEFPAYTSTVTSLAVALNGAALPPARRWRSPASPS